MPDPLHTHVFEIGSRVRLRPDSANNWIDRKLQRRAALGRDAIVTDIYGTMLRPNQRSYRIVFDCAGREKPLSITIPAQELESFS